MTTKRDAWDTLDDVLAADNLDTEGVDASEIISAIDILRRQQANEDAARTALPHKFDKCTYSLGYINQNVYACLTKFDALTEGAFGSAGMCYACSIACHGEHDIVELFVKRRFRCDCGTNVFGKSLAAVDNDGTGCFVNGENRYNHNFQGRYCWCNSVYDVDTESDVMHQCLVCQDWFHTCCIGATPSTHPSMLIEGTSFDDAAFICRVCSTDASSFQPCILSATPAADSNPIMLFLAEGWQHALCDCDTCLNSISSSDLSFLIQPPASASGPKGTKSRPIRPVLCRSPEPIYEPEAEDNDDPLFTMSLHDAGLRLFNQRRDTMSLEQQAAYMRLQNEIIEFLRPFAAEGRVVTRNDILQFFEQKKRDVLKEAGDALGYYDPSAPKPPPSSS
ncbi:hypothetical protein GQ42DRAFT_173789 [Ramicandelaber brevisporus]|nr:hypothetical protein GQ42DRAFT_173789 [Ramicandelaber brevisporus]